MVPGSALEEPLQQLQALHRANSSVLPREVVCLQLPTKQAASKAGDVVQQTNGRPTAEALEREHQINQTADRGCRSSRKGRGACRSNSAPIFSFTAAAGAASA